MEQKEISAEKVINYPFGDLHNRANNDIVVWQNRFPICFPSENVLSLLELLFHFCSFSCFRGPFFTGSYLREVELFLSNLKLNAGRYNLARYQRG